ncbi:hypothetical protein GCM10027187_11020 [Streptosporangium sandarakinum]|uniref:Uncharacterized protein n=1 Tax=Streptosporangium sandarakinum TaxID=1260955 RepID=A0A852UX52_9ACTN|nr:hypothetical protein [Streptosporangium sandarakinum]NYF39793.1 hypothetical protein [Streptosporangium sandarakinum]
MTLRIARAALLAVPVAELVLVVLLLSGAPLPVPVVMAAEGLVAAVFALEAVTFVRLFRDERRRGAGRRAAVRGVARRLVPEPVRRLMGFEARSMASLALWAARRRDGVPPGAVAVPYARGQFSTVLLLLFATVVEGTAVELMLQGGSVPWAVHLVMLALHVYSVVFLLAFGAACATRPHVVSDRELRVRYGVFLDLRVPRELISSVRRASGYGESGMVTVKDGRLGVAVSSQTNVVVELAEPVVAVRPFGRRAEVRVIRFFADDPAAALAALRPPVSGPAPGTGRKPARDAARPDPAIP